MKFVSALSGFHILKQTESAFLLVQLQSFVCMCVHDKLHLQNIEQTQSSYTTYDTHTLGGLYKRCQLSEQEWIFDTISVQTCPASKSCEAYSALDSEMWR